MNKKHGILGFTAHIYGNAFIPKLIVIGLIAAVTSGSQFVLTWYLGNIIDSIGKGLQTVLTYFAVISMAIVLYVAGNAILGYVSGRMTSRFLLNLRIRLGSKLCLAQYTELERTKDGDILSIVTNDVEGFRPWLTALLSLGHIPVKFLFVCASLVFINWRLFFIMLPVLPLAMIPSLLLSKKLHSLTINERESIGRATGFLSEVFSFMLVVKSFCLESLF
jgi:ATP-binding cassette, subfamily B, multidrug efflux pump